VAQSISTDIRHAIVAANGQLMATFSRGDAVSAAAAYTEQGQVLPPNSEAVAGKQAIQTFCQGAMDVGIKAVTLETNEVEGYGNTAHEVGRYTIQGEGGQVIDAGKYVVIWKHEAGQWKLHRDIWNSSRSAPGQ
jgi:ketosteroid isomerase-like protein